MYFVGKTMTTCALFTIVRHIHVSYKPLNAYCITKLHIYKSFALNHMLCMMVRVCMIRLCASQFMLSTLATPWA